MFDLLWKDYNEGKLYGSATPYIKLGNIENFLISIPPIEEQERIISILDKFEVISNSLSAGLPAEIEARKKQYEYYRDKLLAFEMKK